jgi:gamma-glutamyltranspeptidase/glutathione hydrolase
MVFAVAGCATSAGPQRPTLNPATYPASTATAGLPPAPEAASGWDGERRGAWARTAMVATANRHATDAGLRMLRAGGSAVDAAVAAQMMLTLVEPQSSGIGGGLFLVLHEAGRVRALDGRETAPSTVGPDLFLRDGKPMGIAEAIGSGRSVGVPGVLRALEMAHREHGRLPWRDLFAPAIELAERGFPVSPRLARLLREPGAEALRRDPHAAALFFESDGQPKVAGATLRNPALAATLREVAAQGADAFYRGPIAEAIVERVRRHPVQTGALSAADLAGYEARWREPLCFDYDAGAPPALRRTRVCGMPPPSSGTLAIAQMLGMLQAVRESGGPALAALPPKAAPFGLEPDPLAVHLFSQAGRLAFADRGRFVADPDFVRLPAPGVAALLDRPYLAARAALIGERSLGRAEPGEPFPGAAVAWSDDQSADRAGTSHVSIIDARGQAISMTTTIESAFGARLMTNGFLLNNQLTDFSFVPVEGGRPVANRVEAGKRPRSSMAPLLVFERQTDPVAERAADAGMLPPSARTERLGALVASLGSPGGSAIINYVAKALVGLLDWRLDAQQAVELPNFGSRNGPTELEEGRATPASIEALRQRGHEVRVLPQTSGLQAIERRVGPGGPAWFGAADPRREGLAAGP